MDVGNTGEFAAEKSEKEAREIARMIVQKLKSTGRKIAFAESCTGGLLSKLITDVPGSSEVFEYGIVSYSNRIKTDVLGVSRDTVSRYTEVSEETAKEMALNALRISGADIAVSTTGASGPAGAGDSVAGISFIGAAFNGECVCIMIDTRKENLTREENRLYTAKSALRIACDNID